MLTQDGPHIDDEEPPEGWINFKFLHLNSTFRLLLVYSIHVFHVNTFHSVNDRYYAFVESASAIPPSVRPPPYTHVDLECKDIPSKNAFVSVHNICGDLNKGQIPRNPMRQNVLGEPYPLWAFVSKKNQIHQIIFESYFWHFTFF